MLRHAFQTFLNRITPYTAYVLFAYPPEFSLCRTLSRLAVAYPALLRLSLSKISLESTSSWDWNPLGERHLGCVRIDASTSVKADVAPPITTAGAAGQSARCVDAETC